MTSSRRGGKAPANSGASNAAKSVAAKQAKFGAQKPRSGTSEAKAGDDNKQSKGARAMLYAHWEKIAGATVVALIAAVGVWLDPLKDLVLHKIYQERAELALLVEPSEVESGGAISVRVRLTPTSEIDVADGVVKLIYNSGEVALAPGTVDSFNAKRSNQARILDEGTFSLHAKELPDGKKTNIYVTYSTKYGLHTSPMATVHVLPRHKNTHVPFIERSGSKAINLSGEWRIQVGASPGNLKIQQDARNDVEGEYSLGGPQSAKLPVKGYKDGTSFKVFFWRDAQGLQRWFVDSNFAVNQNDPRFIEMKGCAFLISEDRGVTHDSLVSLPDACAKRDFVGWRGIGASTFYATAQMR